MMDEKERKGFFKEWLEKLQQESWQLELLISGLALFGIYESRSWIDQFGIYVDQYHVETSHMALNFIHIVLNAGWKIFFINLLVHVILRGLWIGAIGLRYVSEEIEYDKLNYGSYFTEYLRKTVGEFDDYIESLEKICSVLFAYTFLLFLMFFSLALFFLEVGILFSLLGPFLEKNPFLAILPILFLLVGFVVFIDFITAGLLKKIEERGISKVFGYIFRFYSWITVSFIYRPLLYNFLDNKYTKRLFYFSIPYIILIFTSAKLTKSTPYVYYPENSLSARYGEHIDYMYYEDKRLDLYKETRIAKNMKLFDIPYVTLNSMMIDKPYMEVFVKMSMIEEQRIPDSLDLAPYWKKGLVFTLFSKNNNEDPWYENQANLLKQEITPIREQRRAWRTSIRKDSLSEIEKETLKAKVDSVENLIDNIKETYRKEEGKFKERKLSIIKEKILENTKLKIDDEPIRKSIIDSYYYEHPNNKEKGLMCIVNVDSLSTGRHFLEFRKRNKNRRKINRAKIPFYVIRD